MDKEEFDWIVANQAKWAKEYAEQKSILMKIKCENHTEYQRLDREKRKSKKGISPVLDAVEE